MRSEAIRSAIPNACSECLQANSAAGDLESLVARDIVTEQEAAQVLGGTILAHCSEGLQLAPVCNSGPTKVCGFDKETDGACHYEPRVNENAKRLLSRWKINDTGIVENSTN